MKKKLPRKNSLIEAFFGSIGGPNLLYIGHAQ